MSNISKAIDAFLREYFDPELAAAGFQKKRRRYSRELEDRVELVLVEASSWNRLGTGTFYVNVAIVIPALTVCLRNRVVEMATATGRESGIDTNLGFLLPEGRPRSWLVRLDGPNTEEGSRLKRALIDHALPWFEKARTDSGLLDALASLGSMDSLEARAVLYANQHQYSAVQEMLDEIARRRPDLRDSVAAWAEQRELLKSRP